jgi:DNA repair photolyase
MSIIYEPAGKAREYSELACNLFTGCKHFCKYCYCPGIMRKTLEQWALNPQPRANILNLLEKEARKMEGEARHVLLSFMSDPYQSDEAAAITREALGIFERYHFKNIQILTKAGGRATKDFPILKDNGWKFGSTIIFTSEALREHWEPGATPIQDRIEAVKKAHAMGIYTWVSIEPVVDPEEALAVVEALKGHVDLWKVGKLNHFAEVESKIDWHKFLIDAHKALAGELVYWKKDLLKYESEGQSNG